MPATTPPEAMGFYAATRYAQLGYAIRRDVWTVDVDTPPANSTGKRVTAWITYQGGLYFYRLTDGTPARVVQSTDLVIGDVRAGDWTTRDAEWRQTTPPTAPDGGGDGVPVLPPLPPVLPPSAPAPSGGSGTTGGGTSGGGSTGGGSDPGGTGGGSGGFGGGTGGGKRGRRPARPSRAAPALTLTVTRTATGCVSPLDTDPRPDTFTWNASLAADADARPGEVWFFSLVCKGASRFSGTIAPGGNQSGSFELTAKPGAHFPAMARAYLSGVGISSETTKKARMLGYCGTVPQITGFRLGAATGYSFSVPHSAGTYTLEVESTPAAIGLTVEWFDNLGAPIGSGYTLNVAGGGPFAATYTCVVSNEHDTDTADVSITIAAP